MRKILLIVLLSSPAFGQLWSGLIDPNRATDAWTLAGVEGGIPSATWPNCNNTACNNLFALAPGGSAASNKTAIDNAFNGAQVNGVACTPAAPCVVRMRAGTYNVNGLQLTNSGVVLRGLGADQTSLVFPANSEHGCPALFAAVALCTNNNGRVATNWTAGYAKGTTVITVAAHADMVVGQPIFLTQDNDSVSPSGEWPAVGDIYICEESSTACSSEGGGSTSYQPLLVTNTQWSGYKITSCGTSVAGAACTSNSITLDHGIEAPDYRSTKHPQALAYDSNVFIEWSGIENITLDYSAIGDGVGGLLCVYCYNTWEKGVRSISALNNVSEPYHYTLLWAFRNTARDNYWFGPEAGAGAVNQYQITDFFSFGALYENNIMMKRQAALVTDGPGGGVVFAYNFLAGRPDPGDVIHGAGEIMNLYEGNVMLGFYADEVHGSGVFETVFRNAMIGHRYSSAPFGTTQAMIHLQRHRRFYNIIGNAMGDPSYVNTYETDLADSDTSIYTLGWGGQSPTNDPFVISTLFRWGNYDTVTGTNRFVTSEVPSGIPNFSNPVPACNNTTCFANFKSLYLSAKPAWWPTGKPWPIAGPDVTGGNIANMAGHAYTNPATDCYLNVMGGSVDGHESVPLTFNAATCYGGGAPPQAATPTFSPTAGTFTVGQLVAPSTTSGSVICYTINGTTPATNGTTGCTTGTLFSTALSIGSTTTVKAIAGGTGFTDSTIATATFIINTFNADNLYCPTGTPTWGAVDGPATLPQTCYNTSLANTPATGSVVNVSTSAQLITALAAATCGQKITLLAGNTFTNTGYTLPAISCPANNYLYIQTSAVANLPPEGARYSTTYNGTTIYAPEFGPCYSGVTSQLGRAPLFCPSTPGTYTAKIVTTNTNPALTFTTGTSGVRLIGLEFARTDGTGFVAQLIKVGNVGTIDHVIFDRLYCHGNEDLDETSSCINMSAVSNIAVIDSYMPNFFCAAGVGHNSCDAHALWGGGNNINTTPEHTVKIVNNWLEGAAETIEIGGVAANVVPTDFEVRNNMMFKPLQWNPADPSYDGGLAGGQQIVKNLYEHKTGQRVLVEGNYFINNWAQAQDGTAILLVAKNQTGNLCPICAVEDITFRYNYISTASAPFGLVPTSATDGQLFAAQNDLSVHDNVADNMMYPNCYNCGTPTSGAFQIESIYTINTPARVYRNLTINHNTVVHSSTAVLTFYASVWVGGPTIASGLNNTNLVFKNNVFMGGSSGVLNTPGNGHPTNCGEGLAGANTLLTACYSPIVFTNNCILAHGSVVWPTGQLFVASQTAAYANYNNGDNGDYTIAAGACKGAATDGSDPGANLPTLASVLIGNNPVSRQDIPATYFGLHWKIANFPPLVPSGSVRLWDSLTRWQLLQTGASTYTFTDLDTNLQDAKTLGVDVLFALSTTPNFISSDPTNATCNYNSTANGGCGVPTDIAISCTNVNGNHNCDGKTDGTNQTWRNFIYNMATHIAGLSTSTYQIPSSYEIWNEFTQQGTSGAGTCAQVGGTSWEGTCAQLVRMYSDANCILTGRGAGCTAGAMGVAAVGIFPTAIVTTPSSVMTAPQSTQWGAYLQTSGALTNADVASVHAYTQGGSCCALPETVVTRYNTASGLLSTAGGTQPIWSTEGGWGQVASEPDVDLQAAFVARYYLLGWNAGFKRLYWYSYDSLFGTLWTSGGGLTKAGIAYGQIYSFMVGAVQTAPPTINGTVYSIPYSKSGQNYLVMWDTSKTCSGGVCTTGNQTVASNWLTYQDLTAAPSPQVITANTVPVGAKPILLQASIITRNSSVNSVILGKLERP